MSKIQRIHVKNIKSVSEEVIDLSGCSAIITAGNNKGKTTILNALTDRIRSQKPEIVVKQGETDGIAEMELTTGEKFIWNVNSEGKEKLTFVSKEGFTQPLVKNISGRFFSDRFDIDSFLEKGPLEQSKILQKLVGLDFSDIDKEYKESFDNRTYINRQIKEEESKLTSVDLSLPSELVDINKIQYDLGEAVGKNALLEKNKLEIEDHKKNIALYQNEIKRRTEIQQKLEKEVQGVNPINVDKFKEDLNAAIEKNDLIRKNQQAKEQGKLIDSLKEKSKKIEKDLEGIKTKRNGLLASSKLPVGIDIRDDGVYVDGLPLDRKQVSLSKIYITALKLASMNLADVKALYFDASPLDKPSLSEILDWAKSNDYQLLIERPDFDGGEIKYEIIEQEKGE